MRVFNYKKEEVVDTRAEKRGEGEREPAMNSSSHDRLISHRFEVKSEKKRRKRGISSTHAPYTQTVVRSVVHFSCLSSKQERLRGRKHLNSAAPVLFDLLLPLL